MYRRGYHDYIHNAIGGSTCGISPQVKASARNASRTSAGKSVSATRGGSSGSPPAGSVPATPGAVVCAPKAVLGVEVVGTENAGVAVPWLEDGAGVSEVGC